jgi:hypothetical protein
MIWTALAVTLAAGPALPQAGAQLVKVDLSVVAKGYRMSKLIGSNVINDKNEKIGTVDDVVADKDKKQFSPCCRSAASSASAGALWPCHMTA